VGCVVCAVLAVWVLVKESVLLSCKYLLRISVATKTTNTVTLAKVLLLITLVK